LSTRFAELSTSHLQMGVDDLSIKYGNKFCALRHEEAEIIAARGNANDARLFLRNGTTPSTRGKLWRAALDLPSTVSDMEEKLFRDLRADCDRLDIIVDELFMHDVQSVADDPRFFPFEEELKVAILCFIRDRWVRENAAYEVNEPFLSDGPPTKISKRSTASSTANEAKVGADVSGADGASHSGATSKPPCGVQPFLGFASYVAPLCYMYATRPSLYAVSRAMWCKLWCRLNVLSGDDGTLLHVCKTFENLLASSHPRLYLHLLNMGLSPLHIAFPWIHLGFVGFLEMDQILILWDRLLGYLDPTLLAVLAASVFLTRAETLFTPGMNAEKATLILNEGTHLKVMPLLQLFLCSEL
jgi:Rab-GTPase-TBC domain